MRIGLYGLPSAGKTHILSKIDFMEVISGSTLLHKYAHDFDSQGEIFRNNVREQLARSLMGKPEFIMDGHYAFGNEMAFTEYDGQLFDAFLYLHIKPEVLKTRMSASEKNAKYLRYDVETWQDAEIEGLRNYCHAHQKDFYVIDNPPKGYFDDVSDIIDFIQAIKQGFSCVTFARQCADQILHSMQGTTVTLLDGDKTLTREDSSNKVLGYKTHLYDGNFYTGYQSWKQELDFQKLPTPTLSFLPVQLNIDVLQEIRKPAYILTSGHKEIWSFISRHLSLPFFSGPEMSAETKVIITQELQRAGKKVISYGDSMNDYYMLKQSDVGNLVTKKDGTVSKSLAGKDLEGLRIV